MAETYGGTYRFVPRPPTAKKGPRRGPGADPFPEGAETGGASSEPVYPFPFRSAPMAITALWPPKPKLLLMNVRIWRDFGVSGV